MRKRDHGGHPGGDPSTRLRPTVRWLAVGCAVAALCIVPMLVVGRPFEAWVARTLAATASRPGVATIVVTLLAVDVVGPIPSSIVATIAGQRLGLAGGAAAITIGLCLANLIGYGIGRSASRLLAKLVPRDQLDKARAFAGTRPGAAALALSRPVPMLSEGVIVLAGAARTPPATTAAVCGLANAGLAIAYAAIGNAVHGGAMFAFAMAGSVGLPALAVLALTLATRRRPVQMGAIT